LSCLELSEEVSVYRLGFPVFSKFSRDCNGFIEQYEDPEAWITIVSYGKKEATFWTKILLVASANYYKKRKINRYKLSFLYFALK
jgi:hypothetical protein